LLGRSDRQSLPDRLQPIALRDPRRAERSGRRRIGVERRVLERVVKHCPAVIVQERFRRGAFGIDDRVLLEFDVGIVDPVEPAGSVSCRATLAEVWMIS
jgi:hypothetical protein